MHALYHVVDVWRTAAEAEEASDAEVLVDTRQRNFNLLDGELGILVCVAAGMQAFRNARDLDSWSTVHSSSDAARSHKRLSATLQ
jgi:hypothetical protein